MFNWKGVDVCLTGKGWMCVLLERGGCVFNCKMVDVCLTGKGWMCV